MPRETLTHTATATADIATVWRALDQPSTWEGIAGVDHVYDPVIDEDGRLRGFSFSTVVGGRSYRGKATPYERIEGSVMAWHIDSSEVKGILTVALADRGGETGVTVTIDMESVGMLSSLFFGVIISALRNGLPRTVEAFAAGLAV
jgi:carbon monoxide dehydrogenase subunit G